MLIVENTKMVSNLKTFTIGENQKALETVKIEINKKNFTGEY